MKNISILKTLRIIQVIALIIVLLNLFFGKRLGENAETIVQSIGIGLLAGALILAFAFGKKLEQEKIEREERKEEERRRIK